MSNEQGKHKPGPLKQKNKAHKFGRHRTKGIINDTNRGKVDVKVLLKKSHTLGKMERRNQAKQIRKKKMDDILEQRRKIRSYNAAPIVIGLFQLSSSCDMKEILTYLEGSDNSIVCHRDGIATTVISKRHKQRYTILQPTPNDLISMLDIAKVSDSNIFVLPTSGEIDFYNETCLACLNSQGLAPSVHIIQGLKQIPNKKQSDIRKNIVKHLEKWFPELKIHSLDSKQDGEMLLRQVTNQKPKHIFYREKRSYILAEKTDFEPGMSSVGVLKISGYIRGKSLSVNGLVHLPGLGDFQLKQIDQPQDPYKINRKEQHNIDSMMVEGSKETNKDIKVLAIANPEKQQTLQIEAEVDPMDAEQTWPTEQELLEAEQANKTIEKKLLKVPKGTSEYQSSWIIVDEEEEDGSDFDDTENSEDDDGDDKMGDFSFEKDEELEGDIEYEENGEYDTISVAATTTVNDEKYDEHFDMEEDQKALEKYREEREDDMFPDEVDTPQNIPARERFLRYRGLKSFRTSPWDPKENLPLDYARIFQFQNFNRTKKSVFKNINEDEDNAQAGWYVTVHVNNVPEAYYKNLKKDQPFIIFGILPHEQRMTVMNYAIKRHTSLDIPIKNKEKLIFHVGFRRFSCSPIFSQHTTGDKFKAERFLKQGTTTIATTYAPIMFPPAPVLVFTEQFQLLATGTVLDSNPDRIVVKKIVLSGHPFKINKKSSVVRYMFFNRDDILWFKPVELYTKHGRRGHIKEPLGTHGHMKCVFDGQLKAQDTVCMNLFKRVYPKWTLDYNIILPEITKLPMEKAEENDIEM